MEKIENKEKEPEKIKLKKVELKKIEIPKIEKPEIIKNIHNYYCDNCKNLVGSFSDEEEIYGCNFKKSKFFNSIFSLKCDNCNKYIGLYFIDICTTCFGESLTYERKQIKKLFLKNIKIKSQYENYEHCCKNCKNFNYRQQYWFFKKLTSEKIKNLKN